MPIISTFYGVTIRIYFIQKEHNPPHFHAEYGKDGELIDITTGRVLAGKLPKRAHKMVMEWWDEHREELLEMWKTQNIVELPPLE